MRSPLIKLFGAVFLTGFLFYSLRADIAPTTFVGGGIVPKDNGVIKMRSARVDITWGAPCALKAVFEMENTTGSAQGVTVGFPVPVPYDRISEEPDAKMAGPVAMSFNGKKEIVATPAAVEDQNNNWVWFYKNHDFAPGITTIEVTASLRPSLTKGLAYRERLSYCIETGGKWAGAIAFEEVTIHFPEPLEQGQIDSIKPDSAQIEGNRVRWVFKDIEPRGEEYDIAITYLHPAAMRVLTRLRGDYKKNPSSADAALKLARHLLALGFVYSNSGYLPVRLSENEFRHCLD
ncbi:MAG: hypothetical protein LBI02_07875, partial [Opitutaceae bacterium]|nr:hypothetical protein [Opitutaceae bacterium]